MVATRCCCPASAAQSFGFVVCARVCVYGKAGRPAGWFGVGRFALLVLLAGANMRADNDTTRKLVPSENDTPTHCESVSCGRAPQRSKLQALVIQYVKYIRDRFSLGPFWVFRCGVDMCDTCVVL